jgi:uncharacterized protein YjbI with pentapeptide repeats
VESTLANPGHLAKLKEGGESWGQWRKQNSEVLADLRGADLRGAILDKTFLGRATLTNANLQGAHLREADLSEAKLPYADLSYADLSEAKLREAFLDRANLTRAHLCEAFLDRAILTKANLHRADLYEAILGDADLSGADLSGADLSGANLSGANLSGANLRGADLREADLKEATLVGTNLEGANLTDCSVYGISVWNVSLEGAIQSNLVITPQDESPIQVDNLEVAQFIYLLLNNEKIRDVIDTIGKKAVLILGRFTPERKTVLDKIREALRHYGYLPILFDFERPSTRDTQETIATLAGMVRFIIADITDPKSIPQELASIVSNLPWVPVQPVLQTGHKPWGMYDHIKRYHWVLPLVLYENQETLLTEIEPKVIAPAEAKAKEQTRR